MQSADAGADAVGERAGGGAQPQVGGDRAGLLAQAGLVESFDVQARTQRGHAEHLVDGDDPVPPMPARKTL